jgi:Fic family protein
VTATEVLGNIEAMTCALVSWARTTTSRSPISSKHTAGSSAEFVPPPPELVPDLIKDLCRFCNGDDLPVIVQAAMAHAQFETIHPFVDGNGRIGRALIHLVLRRRGLAVRVLPPISLVLATWSQDYVARLTGTRHFGSSTSDAANAGLNQWIALFATACRRATDDAEAFEARVSALQGRWRERLGRVRADSAVDRFIRALPGAPVVTVNGGAELIGRTYQAANEAIGRLVDARISQQVNVGRRNRAFEAPELIKAFTDLERRLASPAGDTRSSPPTRRVPRRPST